MSQEHSMLPMLARRAVMLMGVWVIALPALAQHPAAQPPAAQQPSPSPQSSAPAPAAPATPALQPESYSYDPGGRRDPFVSLLLRGGDSTLSQEMRPEGREGLGIGEVSVRGIVRTRSSFVAMLQGPDNKTYIVHTGDKMLDGVVKAITADSVVFAQDVNDPLSLVKQREVRKMLRGPEEGK